jgi:hypothetical protein
MLDALSQGQSLDFPQGDLPAPAPQIEPFKE